jgi:hypothetical protein
MTSVTIGSTSGHFWHFWHFTGFGHSAHAGHSIAVNMGTSGHWIGSDKAGHIGSGQDGAAVTASFVS